MAGNADGTSMRLYHNPRCSKSRAALELLRARGVEPELVLYLEDGPDPARLDALVDKLGGDPRTLIRDTEPEYTELGLDDPTLGRPALLAALARHPRLLQRPILETQRSARIGRPPEAVLELL
jgi:arsenate reductase